MNTLLKELTEDHSAYEEIVNALHYTIQEHLNTPSEDGFDVVTDTFKHHIEECSDDAIMVAAELDIEGLLMEGISEVNQAIGDKISDTSWNAAVSSLRAHIAYAA